MSPGQPVSQCNVVTMVTGPMVGAVDVKQNTEQLTDIYVTFYERDPRSQPHTVTCSS